MSKQDELTLLMFEAQGEHTDKTALQIIEEEAHEEEQAKRAYVLFEDMVVNKNYTVASKLANVLYYKFGIDVTA